MVKKVIGYLGIASVKGVNNIFSGFVTYKGNKKFFLGINPIDEKGLFELAQDDRDRVTIIGLIRFVQAMKVPVQLSIFVYNSKVVRFINAHHTIGQIKKAKDADLWLKLAEICKAKGVVLHVKHTKLAKNKEAVTSSIKNAKRNSKILADYILNQEYKYIG